MVLTYDGLLKLYPEDSNEISQISEAELANINKFLAGDIAEYTPTKGSIIKIEAEPASHTLHTTANENDGTGHRLSSSARGYRSRKLPEFTAGSGYNVSLHGTTITLRIEGTPYIFASSDGSQLQPSHASGTFV